MLIHLAVSRDKPPHLRVVVPRSNLHQPRIALVAITAGGCEHVGACRRTGAANRVAKAIVVHGSSNRLAGIGDRPLTSKAVKERVLAIFSDEGVAVSGNSRVGRAL